MQRHSFFVGWVVILLTLAPATTSLAQPPDRLSQYRFLPRHSTLHVEGGFAGFDIQANIFGTFQFVNGYHFEFPRLDPYAAFREVDAVAINPTDFGPYSFDVDEALHLTSMTGKPLPIAAPFELFLFRGEDGQGARTELTVIQFDHWLYMKGSNEAPCCDFFNYQIEAIARRTPFADFSADDLIDQRDLTAWSDGFGSSGSGDADGDDDSDGGDFLIWQRQLGESMPSMESFAVLAANSGELAALAAVPEPATFVLISVSLLITTQCRPMRVRGG